MKNLLNDMVSKNNFIKALFVFWLSISSTQSNAQMIDLNSVFPVDSSIRTGTLANGMKYYIKKNQKPENRAELRLAVNVGSTMENENQLGLAHFVEHMAFNGTKNFKKNDLVNYLESIGTKFGAHLNAYTSFDETVYMLQVPTDKPEFMDKGLMILNDWAFGLSFDSLEIEKERGVIIEEWRLGQGADERMRNQYWPTLFKGSRYESRLPIGTKKNLETFKHSDLKKFYFDFYRPENMAIVIVGDIDVNKVEQAIKKQFSASPYKDKAPSINEWKVEAHDGIRVKSVRDDENPYTLVQVIYKHPAFEEKVIGDYRKNLVISAIGIMLNNRLEELSKNSTSGILYASAGYGSFVRTTDAFYGVALLNEKNIKDAIFNYVAELEKVSQFGFTATELDRAKKSLLRNIEKGYEERTKTESSSYADEYIRNFLSGEPIPGIAFEKAIYDQYVPSITLDEVNREIKKLITPNKNEAVILMASGSLKEKITDEQLKDWVQTAHNQKVSAYKDEVINSPLLPSLPSNSGKIVKESKSEIFGAGVWELQNGMTVIYKQTDYKNDEIRFYGNMLGGTSLAPAGKEYSADFASYIIEQSGVGNYDNIQITKFLSDKIVSVNLGISEYNNIINGFCSPKDLEVAMQMIYAYIKFPRFDEKAFENVMSNYAAMLANRGNDPESVFQDSVNFILNSYHPRYKPNNVEDLKKVNHKDAYDFYKSSFGSVNGMRMVFVGNIPLDSFKIYVEKYLATLPSSDKSSSYKDLNVKTLAGNYSKIINKGIEPKSSVQMIYTGSFENNIKNRLEFNALMKLISIKLRENLREDKGGTYGVGAYNSIQRIPKSEYKVFIVWGCAPDNLDLLLSAAKEEISKTKNGLCSIEDLNKVKETLKRDKESAEKTNSFWVSTLNSYYSSGENQENYKLYNSYIDALTPQMMQELAKKYFNDSELKIFILNPEQP